MEEIKMLPYGISDFEDLRRQNMYYADKTMYMPLLERTCDFLYLVRPQGFGKSTFLSMLRCYYDIAMQDEFDTLFDRLWIKDNPTPLKGAYQIMYFDFSQAAIGNGDLEEKFHKYCSAVLCDFADRYSNFYGERFYDTVLNKAPDSADQLRYICMEAKMRKIQLYLIIDEYDNFTNDALNEQGESVYNTLNRDTYFYQTVFKLYKTNFQRIIYMGINPVSLNGLTSGFCIAWDLCSDPRFNMMLGFSETEVREMISYYKEAGMIKADTEEMIEEMKPWYDNYCFAQESLETDPKMFNSDMVIYYLRNHILKGVPPKQMLDVNTRTDYKKLKKLMLLDGMTDKERSVIRRIAAEDKILGNINTSFPAERIFDRENFLSLLYYYGMLTMSGTYGSLLELSIPNNNVRKQYYEYLLQEYSAEAGIDFSRLQLAYYDMAFGGQWRETMEMIAEDYKNAAIKREQSSLLGLPNESRVGEANASSVRNAIEGERNLQGFVMASLSTNAYYVLAPEMEMKHGYCDIFLMPDKVRYPGVKHSYILELKYLKAGDSEEEAQKQWDEGVEQVRLYATDRKVEVMTRDTQLHLIVMQIRVCELVRLEEI